MATEIIIITFERLLLCTCERKERDSCHGKNENNRRHNVCKVIAVHMWEKRESNHGKGRTAGQPIRICYSRFIKKNVMSLVRSKSRVRYIWEYSWFSPEIISETPPENFFVFFSDVALHVPFPLICTIMGQIECETCQKHVEFIYNKSKFLPIYYRNFLVIMLFLYVIFAYI